MRSILESRVPVKYWVFVGIRFGRLAAHCSTQLEAEWF
jgi:hypothetical protein